MSKKLSILEQALLQVQTLEEVVKQNAHGILASTMKKELNGLLKEQEDEEEIPDEENDVDPTDVNPTDGEIPTVPSDESMEDDEDPTEESMEDEDDLDGELEDDEYETDDESEDDDVLDMTNASHEDIVKVFRSLKPEDGIVIKKDGNKLEMTIDDEDYIIKLGDDDESSELNEQFEDDDSEYLPNPPSRVRIKPREDGGEDWVPEYGDDEDDELSFEDDEELGEGYEDLEGDEEIGDEEIYEITLDDDDEEGIKDEPGYETPDEEEFSESARTLGYGYRGGIKSKNVFKAGNKRDEINEEVSRLKKQNGEYKKALVLFKEKLNEVAIFNANLAYSTRLFTEHTTTKSEKLSILKRFDSISNMNESKNLYKQIKSELGNKKPITESVAEKISTTPTSSSSKETLSESKTYESPQFKRMRDLMNKIK